nr:uncharacterized protein LOC128685338 [Cherax quadricarinatus]
MKAVVEIILDESSLENLPRIAGYTSWMRRDSTTQADTDRQTRQTQPYSQADRDVSSGKHNISDQGDTTVQTRQTQGEQTRGQDIQTQTWGPGPKQTVQTQQYRPGQTQTTAQGIQLQTQGNTEDRRRETQNKGAGRPDNTDEGNTEDNAGRHNIQTQGARQTKGRHDSTSQQTQTGQTQADTTLQTGRHRTVQTQADTDSKRAPQHRQYRRRENTDSRGAGKQTEQTQTVQTQGTQTVQTQTKQTYRHRQYRHRQKRHRQTTQTEQTQGDTDSTTHKHNSTDAENTDGATQGDTTFRRRETQQYRPGKHRQYRRRQTQTVQTRADTTLQAQQHRHTDTDMQTQGERSIKCVFTDLFVEVRLNGLNRWLTSVFEADDCVSDITPAQPQWDNLRLTCAALVCEDMRRAVLERTGFKCSAGIAHNKMLAKLSCGLHKPNQQTVLPQFGVGQLWETTKVGSVRNLGGKLGDSLTEELCCTTMADLGRLSLQQLKGRYDDKTSLWLHNLGQGIDTEPVTSRQLPKSIGCGKNFQGREVLNTREKVRMQQVLWFNFSVLCAGYVFFQSHYCAFMFFFILIIEDYSLLFNFRMPAIKNISLSAGRFEDWEGACSGNIQDMFKKVTLNKSLASRREKIHCNPCKEETFVGEISGTSKPPPIVQSSTISAESLSGNCKPNEEFITQVQDNVVKERSSIISCSLNLHQKSGANVTSSESLYEETKNIHKISSNSFFKNFLLKKQKIENACTNLIKEDKKDHASFETLEECNNTEEEEEAACSINSTESQDDRCNKSNLDLLVSFIDEMQSNSNDKVIENKVAEVVGTDVCHSINTQETAVCVSPDLFSSEKTDDLLEEVQPRDCLRNSGGAKIISCTKKATLIPSSQVVAAETERKLSINTNYTLTSSLSPNINSPGQELQQHMQETKNCSDVQNSTISVKELIPDLDSFDDSLLPLLPKDLRLEVEKELTLHKAKSKKMFVKKSGILKYFSESPSKCTTDVKMNEYSEPENRHRITSYGAASSSITDCLSNHKNDVGTKEKCKTDNLVISEIDVKNMVECEECGCHISTFELAEHFDYHVALKLQTDMQQENTVGSDKAPNKAVMKIKRGKGKKRGRTSKGETYLENKKMKTIDLFFRR